ncbi:HAMP domain-containing sensor histidine kinase [Neomegalonema sp.]|uniref:sensor histidine kinase n=1 Tax=Neomegalonema sp. TaxID=2039713 RepID=UPI002630B039|nr:HAMP domain-containing sensor histidine kinase [Neomegalonema sp.]MDD2867293.1 HAMP domain-containing sensor histidine kinase [Neomegalonema sp.]
MRLRPPGLRLRLSLGATALAALAVFAAGLAVRGLARTESLAGEAIAAQHRIESLSSLSARVNEWALRRVSGVSEGAQEGAEDFAVAATFALLDVLLDEDVQAAPDAAERLRREGRKIDLARLRGHFSLLERQLRLADGDPAASMAALNQHSLQADPLIAARIQQDARRRDRALGDMEALRLRLRRLALILAAAAPLTLLALHLLLVRPLGRRLAGAARAAEGLSLAPPEGAGGHDELGLLFARIRQMRARLDRRQARLAADRERLEAIVEERGSALRAANQRLERVDAERRRFFADVGHELRTPLTVILGEAELGLRDPDPLRRESFGAIRSRALRLYRRIEDLLRIARSESGRLDLERAPTDLGEALAQAAEDAAPLLKRAGVGLRREAPEGLIVEGDADWLRQVFAGVFENAAKYAGRGAVVTISGRREGGSALVEIRDDGPGLPPELLARAFARFERAEPEEGPPRGGFGVGLALARWVTEAHGGSVEGFSPAAPEGRGLGLRFLLPLAERRPDLNAGPDRGPNLEEERA